MICLCFAYGLLMRCLLLTNDLSGSKHVQVLRSCENWLVTFHLRMTFELALWRKGSLVSLDLFLV
jgi:hypothetical protein